MLFELGAYKLFRKDPVVTWRFMRLWLPTVIRVLAPNAGYGVARLPATGGAVLAANHLNAIDPPAIGVYSTRAIRYMTKVELLQIPIAGEFLRMTGTFAVRRGEGDRDSLRCSPLGPPRPPPSRTACTHAGSVHAARVPALLGSSRLHARRRAARHDHGRECLATYFAGATTDARRDARRPAGGFHVGRAREAFVDGTHQRGWCASLDSQRLQFAPLSLNTVEPVTRPLMMASSGSVSSNAAQHEQRRVQHNSYVKP